MKLQIHPCSQLTTFEVIKYLWRNTMVDNYLTTAELAARIKYDARTIRERLKE